MGNSLGVVVATDLLLVEWDYNFLVLRHTALERKDLTVLRLFDYFETLPILLQTQV